ncbi:hypothetical protein cypCar_00022710 [Cyprinus carpio]|nr:hypothetical protein cypCar_00022710 [Cyprinus carpio]
MVNITRQLQKALQIYTLSSNIIGTPLLPSSLFLKPQIALKSASKTSDVLVERALQESRGRHGTRLPKQKA